MKKIFVWACMLLALSSCSQIDRKAQKLAVMQVEMTNSNDLEILSTSKADSLFDMGYCSKGEIQTLMKQMKIVSDTIMKRTSGLKRFNPNDDYVIELVRRQMKAMSDIQAMRFQSKQKGEWIGWKVRVLFASKNEAGRKVRTSRLVMMDKDA